MDARRITSKPIWVAAVSADGFYEIDNTGVITITNEGVTAGANDFESFVAPTDPYLVRMTDGADNITDATITLNVTDVRELVDFADQSHSFAEHQVEDAIVATLSASDAANFDFFYLDKNDLELHDTSKDGFYRIDASGVISITAEGVQSNANDYQFEIGFVYSRVRKVGALGLTVGAVFVEENAPVTSRGFTIRATH